MAAAARALLLAVIPCSLVWFPVARTPAGTLAGSDAAMIALWAVIAVDLLTNGARRTDVYTPLVPLLAFAIGLLAGTGAELSHAHGDWLLEVMIFMKRFGLAAVIPLAAARFSDPTMAGRMRLITAASVIALAVFTLHPELAAVLPRPDEWDGSMAERATGLGTNPNDLAYAAISLAVLHAALLPRRASLAGQVSAAGVMAGTGVCVVASGSRSGVAGAAAAIGFLLASRAIGRPAKLVIVVVAAAAVVGGFSMNETFRERIDRVYRRGAAEENVAGRVYAQLSALRASLDHPLGVGYRNIAWATRRAGAVYEIRTTDSVYLDTLVGAGVFGLAILLALLGIAWRLTGSATVDDRTVALLRAGLIAFLVFGAATVVPISVFLSPLFFTIVSGAAHASERRS